MLLQCIVVLVLGGGGGGGGVLTFIVTGIHCTVLNIPECKMFLQEIATTSGLGHQFSQFHQIWQNFYNVCSIAFLLVSVKKYFLSTY